MEKDLKNVSSQTDGAAPVDDQKGELNSKAL